jgi:hypothetical protein
VKESLRSGKPALPFVDRGIETLRDGLREGYPAAHLYNHLGFLWLLRQNEPEAKKAFRQALKAPINLTDSALHL